MTHLTDEQAATAKYNEFLYETPSVIGLKLFTDGFLAGAAHARTAIKIDPNDKSTWPPNGVSFLGLLNNGEWRLLSCLLNGITHWAELPTLPAGKEG